jgi:predicted O-methyltransferase YrrM
VNDHERCEHNEREIGYLRDLFEAEIKRIDSLLSEREKQTDAALRGAEVAGEKAEAEALRARQAANEWRQAMSDREHRFATVSSMDTMKEELSLVRAALSEWQGRRVAWIAAAGIIATLLAIGVGQIIRSGITAADVSNQIQREAPWNRDKAGVERRITVLEKRQEQVRIELSRLEQRIDSICSEHKPTVC